MPENDRTGRIPAGSAAGAPEDAAALVRNFSRVPAGHIFCGESDVKAMRGLTGRFWEHPRVNACSYQSFCAVFRRAMECDNDFALVSFRPEDFNPYRPVWGVRVNNALVLWAEMLLDQAMGRGRNTDIGRCMEMPLGRYLDVLAGPGFRQSETEAELFLAWRGGLLRDCGGGQPLAETLAGILRRYMSARKEIGRLDHILRLITGPADEYEADLPEIGGEPSAGALRGQIFLTGRDYSPGALGELAAKAPYPEFRLLLKEFLSGDRAAAAMWEINKAVADFYMLWVQPYLCMEEQDFASTGSAIL